MVSSLILKTGVFLNLLVAIVVLAFPFLEITNYIKLGLASSGFRFR